MAFDQVDSYLTQILHELTSLLETLKENRIQLIKLKTKDW